MTAALLALLGAGGAAHSRGQTPDLPATVLQTATPYHPKTNLRPALVLVAADESARGLARAAANVRSWRERGSRVFGFASLARVYRYYMDGGWRDLSDQVDAGGHAGEVQRDRFGHRFGPHEFMLTPSLRLVEHKKLWAKAFLDAGVEGMTFEEPDLFMDGGYDEQFRREWQSFYHEAWQAPHSSLQARVKAERLKAHLGFRSYRLLSEFCKEQGGPDFRFMVGTHSLPNYMLWGISFNYWETLSLPSVDLLQAQVWTGTAKTPVLWEGELQERLFDNAFVDYSYAANLGEALRKPVLFNLDPYEDEPGLPFEFYRRGFRNTLAASLMFPGVKSWEILPWPNRIYTNDRIPPPYGTELQNVLAAMSEIAGAKPGGFAGTFPRTGILFSETALREMRDPSPSNPQSLFALALPLLSMGVPVDVVPLEATSVREYLDRFKVLLLSYDFFKPERPAFQAALAAWVKRGGTLLLVGGRSAYNDGPGWWRQAGYGDPTTELLHRLGLAAGEPRLVTQRPQSLANGAGTPLAGLFAGLRGADHVPRAVSFVPNGAFPELNYLDTQSGPGHARRDFRYADASGFFTYRFDTRGLRSLRLKADLANGFLVEASTDGRTWKELASSIREGRGDVRDGSNRGERDLDLKPFLPGKTVWVRFRDPSPENGWGPTLRKLTLFPERTGAEPRGTPALELRDSYCVAYAGLRKPAAVWIRGAKGEPVAFTDRVGQGRVFTVGAPPALFGASAERSEMLRRLYRQACSDAGLALHPEGCLDLTRGDYRIVYPFRQPRQLTGLFIDVLSPELDLRENPTVPAGSPALLRRVKLEPPGGPPRLLFASHEVREVKTGAALAFTVEGPERIPAAARVQARGGARVSAARVTGGQPVTVERVPGPHGTLLLRFQNADGGVRCEVRPAQ